MREGFKTGKGDCDGRLLQAEQLESKNMYNSGKLSHRKRHFPRSQEVGANG